MEQSELKKAIDGLLLGKQYIGLFYTEAGSRLLGIANKDSDFDVRGVHLLSKNDYINFLPQPDVLEMVENKPERKLLNVEQKEKLPNSLDFVSYEWDKFMLMLLKSNPNVWEFWRSEQFYFNELLDFDLLRKKSYELVDFKPMYYYYASIAKSHLVLLEKKPSYKVVFYGLRGLLAGYCASRSVLADLPMSELLQSAEAAGTEREKNIAKHCQEMLFYKQNEPEKQLNEKNQQFFTQFIAEETTKLLSLRPSFQSKENELQELLIKLNVAVKNRYYG
jgi:uncharacterized protein